MHPYIHESKNDALKTKLRRLCLKEFAGRVTDVESTPGAVGLFGWSGRGRRIIEVVVEGRIGLDFESEFVPVEVFREILRFRFSHRRILCPHTVSRILYKGWNYAVLLTFVKTAPFWPVFSHSRLACETFFVFSSNSRIWFSERHFASSKNLWQGKFKQHESKRNSIHGTRYGWEERYQLTVYISYIPSAPRVQCGIFYELGSQTCDKV